MDFNYSNQVERYSPKKELPVENMPTPHSHTYFQDCILSMEWGFKACEKGWNFDKTLEEYEKFWKEARQ